MTTRAELERQVDEGRADLDKINKEEAFLRGRAAVVLDRILVARRKLWAMDRPPAAPDTTAKPPSDPL